MRLRPAYGDALPGLRETRQGIFTADALQIIHAQRRHIKTHIGEFCAIGKARNR